jgi:Peptidase A4 family
MSRRWCIPLTALALLIGSMLAAGGASAATAAARPAAAHAISPGGPMIRTAAGAALQGAARVRNQAQSMNWSGYAATGGNGAFKSVSASWTEPTGACLFPPVKADYYSSFWVGLDGYTSGSVEQTGTELDCDGPTKKYYGWYEMYPAAPVNFANTVKPGDHFSASVTFSGTETYTLVLKDSTQGWTQTITKNQSGLDRSSAEVITEAPSSGTGVLPLVDFGSVSYSVSAANGTSLGTQNPTQIIMVDSNGNAKDTTSAISSAGAFSDNWIRSN